MSDDTQQRLPARVRRQCIAGSGIPKIKYATEREARASLDRPLTRRSEGGSLPVAYQCAACGLWHIGTPKKEAANAY